MTQNAVETTTIETGVSLEELAPGDDRLDPRAVAIRRTAYVATRVLLEIHDALDTDTLDAANTRLPITQPYVDALEDAVTCWQKLRTRDDYDEFLQDVSTLDDETLAEVRGTIVYVAPHFGIDVELPAPADPAGGAR